MRLIEGERIRFELSKNSVNPIKLEEVLAYFEETFQQHGLEIGFISTNFYGTNVKIKGGDVVRADVGLNIDIELKYCLATCKATMRGFFINPNKWENKKWLLKFISGFNSDNLESIAVSECVSAQVNAPKMKTEALIKYIKKYARA